ncbi:sporulation related protein [Oceanicella actignis]|nr:sporulation related protein [Oceanicella actignis]
MDAAAPRRAGPLWAGLGAAAALTLIGALALWSWRLVQRDPAQVPVIRAVEGPMKIRPEDPGGLTLDEADRAVTRIVSGEAQDGAERLAPPPEPLADEDLPPALLPAPTRSPAGTEGPSAPADEDADAAADAGAGALDALVSRALGEADDAPAMPSAPAAPAESAPAASTPAASAPAASSPAPNPAPAAAEATPEPVDASALAPRVAPIAPGRPAAGRAAAAPEAPPPAPPVIKPGDVLVQLGAFASPEVAEGQWREHLRRNGALLGGLTHVVVPVQSGGRTLHRLRAGPLPDRARAEELCAALKGRGEACIVARAGR